MVRARVPERPALWGLLLALSAIALAVSIRRLTILAGAQQSVPPGLAVLDDFFFDKQALTRAHVIVGLSFVLALPLQLSARVRTLRPSFHRWLGRILLIDAVAIATTAYMMVAVPVGGLAEMSATIVFATAFVLALSIAWWHIRHRDVARHREWMLRAAAILLGIATTRPVMGIFFATRAFTHLTISQFFGVAFWIGFTSTLLAAEVYIRATRPKALPKLLA